MIAVVVMVAVMMTMQRLLAWRREKVS